MLNVHGFTEGGHYAVAYPGFDVGDLGGKTKRKRRKRGGMREERGGRRERWDIFAAMLISMSLYPSHLLLGVQY